MHANGLESYCLSVPDTMANMNSRYKNNDVIKAGKTETDYLLKYTARVAARTRIQVPSTQETTTTIRRESANTHRHDEDFIGPTANVCGCNGAKVPVAHCRCS